MVGRGFFALSKSHLELVLQEPANFAFHQRAVIMGETMETDNSWLNNRPPRLGDLIDDHCPRCKRVMNHAIASFMGDKVVKVICQTCYSEHPYLEGKERKKTPKTAPTAFDQVLSKIAPQAETPSTPGDKKVKPRPATRALYRHKAKSPAKEQDQ